MNLKANYMNQKNSWVNLFISIMGSYSDFTEGAKLQKKHFIVMIKYDQENY